MLSTKVFWFQIHNYWDEITSAIESTILRWSELSRKFCFLLLLTLLKKSECLLRYHSSNNVNNHIMNMCNSSFIFCFQSIYPLWIFNEHHVFKIYSKMIESWWWIGCLLDLIERRQKNDHHLKRFEEIIPNQGIWLWSGCYVVWTPVDGKKMGGNSRQYCPAL